MYVYRVSYLDILKGRTFILYIWNLEHYEQHFFQMMNIRVNIGITALVQFHSPSIKLQFVTTPIPRLYY
jgi:hypothetical protein